MSDILWYLGNNMFAQDALFLAICFVLRYFKVIEFEAWTVFHYLKVEDLKGEMECISNV